MLETIGGVSFDGSANINLPGVNATGNQDTSGNAATATALETARTIGGVRLDGTSGINLPGVNQAGNQDTSGNAATATALETARSIGGVSFNGSADINLPGVNATGNQDTSGNAATATALATSRTLAISGDAGSASFDGSANATISATLANSGVSAATYGSTTEIPVIAIDAKGRVTSATTAAVGSGLTVTGDTGSEDINLLSETLTIAGGTNLTSAAASNGVTVNLNDDISIATAAVSGVVTASGGFVGNITGDVTGNADTATALANARTIGEFPSMVHLTSTYLVLTQQVTKIPQVMLLLQLLLRLLEQSVEFPSTVLATSTCLVLTLQVIRTQLEPLLLLKD